MKMLLDYASFIMIWLDYVHSCGSCLVDLFGNSDRIYESPPFRTPISIFIFGDRKIPKFFKPDL